MAYVFEPLDPSRHDRAAFSCGEPALDAYIKAQARQDMARDLAVCWVLRETGNREIIGYYTLTPTSVEIADLPQEVAKTAGRYKVVPAALIGRMAVDRQYQGQHIGERLLLDALRRSLHGGFAFKLVVVDALNSQVVSFYTRYDFVAFADDPLRLYLLMTQVRTLFPDDTPPDAATPNA